MRYIYVGAQYKPWIDFYSRGLDVVSTEDIDKLLKMARAGLEQGWQVILTPVSEAREDKQ